MIVAATISFDTSLVRSQGSGSAQETLVDRDTDDEGSGGGIVNALVAPTGPAERKPWLRSKSFDTFCPVGPWVVPRDSVPGAHDLAIRLWVNGELRQDSRTSLMVVAVEDAIAYLSRHTTLHCGDLIAMGTPEGVGALRPGDRVEGAIEQLGMLVNDVAREAEPKS